MRSFEFPSTLRKAADTAGRWVVGGVASSFHQDLDGEAITPDAVARAIPDFMAPRGQLGLQGGEIRLHHGFWHNLLRDAVDMLLLPGQDKKDLIAAISLPLGRVTKIWVDADGTTQWKGILSQVNPIARIVWQMLQEGLVSLGVSLGGKILETRPGVDATGKPCTLITSIRLDELSITSNPALRLPKGESTGAYIMALAKSARTALRNDTTMKVEKFLKAAIAGIDDSGYRTGLERDIGEPKTAKARGASSSVKMDASTVTTGMGGKPEKTPRPTGATEVQADVWGITAKQFARQLSKACKDCGPDKAVWGAEDMAKALTKGAYGLTTLTAEPPPALVNFVKFLQYLQRFCLALPNMDAWNADETVKAMVSDLEVAIANFQSQMPAELMDQQFGEINPERIEMVMPQYYLG